MHRLDEGLRSLIESAQKRGFLTYQAVDEYLPDEGGDPRLVDQIILALEETGSPLINDPDAPDTVADKTRLAEHRQGRRASRHCPLDDRAGDAAMSSRDPIRMYLTQMGNIPLLSRDDEIFLAKQIEITRKRFRRTMMESDFALDIAVDILEKVQQRRTPLRADAADLGYREHSEGADSRPHATQPPDAAAFAG